MDPTRFDSLTRAVSQGANRRTLLRLVGASLAPLLPSLSTSTTDAATRRRPGRDQRTGTAATSCARRCRNKKSKPAHRRCRKRCQTPPECTTSADCPAGELCESGVCLPIPDQCTRDADCDQCERCQDGVCGPRCQEQETCCRSTDGVETCCPAGDTCQQGQCVTTQCRTDRECGDCSRCQDGQCRWQCAVTEVCLSGAGGRCCQPRSCPAGLDCGTVEDGCGGSVRCGTCTAPERCGGGGTPNVCGCTPIATCPAGTNCGTIEDGCGGTVRCGPDVCSQPSDPCQQTTCEANICTTGSGNDGAACATGQTCATGVCQAGACLVSSPCSGATPVCIGTTCVSCASVCNPLEVCITEMTGEVYCTDTVSTDFPCQDCTATSQCDEPDEVCVASALDRVNQTVFFICPEDPVPGQGFCLVVPRA